MKDTEENKEEKYFLKAKKSLGQHFLRSEKALDIMAECVEKIVFEIGPGEGVLTKKFLETGHTVFVIEIDKRSIELLKEKFKEEIINEKLFIIESDCLEIEYYKILEKYFPENKNYNYSLIGNIPYYITGAIFRHTFEQKVLPKEAKFLIQKEVAQRIIANDKKESLLSISVKIFAQEVKILDIVKAGSFVPPPKVDSAIISIKNIFSPFKDFSQQEIFFKILKASFSHKRKLLLANLKTDLEQNLFEKYFETTKKIILENYSEKVRGEDIDLKVWLELIKSL